VSSGEEVAQERQHLAAPELLPNDDLLIGVDPVNLEHVLGDIQTDRGNLHLDGSPHVIRLRRSLFGTSMPGAGAVHHIKGRRGRPHPGPCKKPQYAGSGPKSATPLDGENVPEANAPSGRFWFFGVELHN
jgi:hypothetical protein